MNIQMIIYQPSYRMLALNDIYFFVHHQTADFKSLFLEIWSEIPDGSQIVFIANSGDHIFTKVGNIAYNEQTNFNVVAGYNDIDGLWRSGELFLFMSNIYNLETNLTLFSFAVEGGAGISDIRLTKKGKDPR